MDNLTWTPITVRLSALDFWERNPKRLTKAQAKRLADSTDRLGRAGVLLVGPQDARGHYPLYDGHQRANIWRTLYGADAEVHALQSSRELSEDERLSVSLLTVTAVGSLDFDALAGWDATVLRDLGLGLDYKHELDDAAANIAAMLEAVAADAAPVADVAPQLDRAEELQERWQVQPGDVWQMGQHFVICGDCREPETWTRLLTAAGVGKVNGVFTSPPYAMQRKEQYGGVEASQYVEWWDAVQSNVRANLADDGSFFVNIKPHCEDGQRVLYVFDLVLAMVRRWGWRFVDELCWRHTDGGIPGVWSNRFKNAFEPIYHFSACGDIKFREENVRHKSDSVFDYSANNTNSRISGLLSKKANGHRTGMARASNVIEVASDSSGLGHAAAFPVALPTFFVKAYSDAGDVWLDPFLGSGTTLIAAHNENRIGLGVEKLEKYVAVTLQRWVDATGGTPVRLENAKWTKG